MQTIDSVKENLPDVPVIDYGKRRMFWLRGRKLRFAILADPLDHDRHCEVAWSTVVRVLNNPNGAIRFA